MLVAARALQGAFGALLAPSALSLLTVTFADSPDRAKAFGIFGAIAGGGASVGLLLGGILTEALSWRWCLYVNLVIALPAAVVALRLLVNQRNPARPRIDWPGVLVASLGPVRARLRLLERGDRLVVRPDHDRSRSPPAPCCSPRSSSIERRAAHPLLPLHIVWDRARGGAYASIALAGAGVFGGVPLPHLLHAAEPRLLAAEDRAWPSCR